MTSRSVQHIVNCATRLAGLEQRVTPYTLRHTFASRYLEAGGTLAELRDTLCHANITTNCYSHAKPRECKRWWKARSIALWKTLILYSWLR